MALDLGGITPILWSFIERDEIVDMLAALTGQKLLYNYYRIGGVNGDLNHEFMSRLGNWMSRAAAQIDSNTGLMNENELFVRRTRGLGTLDQATALRMGVTGPNLRATGVPFDLRRDHPYLVYPELEFNVPTRDEGDSLARYMVRIDEIRESIRIIDQVLHEMPDGPVMAKLPRLIRPRPGRACGAVEGPRFRRMGRASGRQQQRALGKSRAVGGARKVVPRGARVGHGLVLCTLEHVPRQRHAVLNCQAQARCRVGHGLQPRRRRRHRRASELHALIHGNQPVLRARSGAQMEGAGGGAHRTHARAGCAPPRQLQLTCS
jgi:hypothetical protein